MRCWPLGKLNIVFVAYLALNSPYSRILNQDLDLMRKNYKLWGPSARTCMSLTNDNALERHKRKLDRAVDRFTKDFTQFEKIDAASVSHQLFVVRPTESRQYETVEFASDHVLGLVSRAYATRDHAARQYFYKTISGHTWFGASVGRIFETSVLLWFRHSPDNDFIQCHSALNRIPDLRIEPCRENIRYFDKVDELKNVHEEETQLCMVPISQTFKTVDAIIITKLSIITVQMTVSHTHGANLEGFKNIYDAFSPELLSQRGRYHVFITDTVDKAISLGRQKTLAERVKIDMSIKLYSAFIEFEKLDSVITGKRVDELETNRASSCHWLYVIDTYW